MTDNPTRTERDSIGEMEIANGALYGIHTARALLNFPITSRTVHPDLIRAYGTVKLACATTNRALGWWKDDVPKAEAIERACREVAEGTHDDSLPLSAFQGGAGTSLNLGVSEVIANRALQLLSHAPGDHTRVSPLDDVNLHQSTNDTYPTALRLAAIRMLKRLESSLVALQESFQAAEKKFAHVVKVGRTELQDAVLTTLGREMSAYAEAIARDRWRIYKCEERLRVVNLGGTAIGTGLAAPRQYVFRVVDTLRELTGIGFARAENLIDGTQNADAFTEVSGILKACAVNLLKISGDLRLMASGPDSGLGEITLPARQAGSSIMPGKVNPVIPEAVSQSAMMVMGHDSVIAQACAAGNLELNPFLPLIAHCLLESAELLIGSTDTLRRFCIDGIEANEDRCRAHVENSTAAATALLPFIGYEQAAAIARQASISGKTIREIVIERKILTAEEFDRAISPEAVTRLGSRDASPPAPKS